MPWPTLFNVAVGIVVRHCISLTVEDNYATHDVIGMALGRCMEVFYVCYVMIGLRDP